MFALLKQARTGFFITMIGLMLTSIISPVMALAATDLVPGDDRQSARREVPLTQLQIRAADPAGVHPEQHLARSRLGDPPLDQAQRTGRDRPRLLDNPCPHDSKSRTAAGRRVGSSTGQTGSAGTRRSSTAPPGVRQSMRSPIR